MTEITRNILLDLIPVYLAGEASEDTRKLVEKYLETDKELAKMVEQSQTFNLPGDVPVAVNQDQALQLYMQSKRLNTFRTIALAMIISFSILCLLVIVGGGLLFLTG
jgi:hypothetical protein